MGVTDRDLDRFFFWLGEDSICDFLGLELWLTTLVIDLSLFLGETISDLDLLTGEVFRELGLFSDRFGVPFSLSVDSLAFNLELS